jgi:hypothetical protein
MNDKNANSDEELNMKQKLAKLEKENLELLVELRGQKDNAGIPLDAYIEVMSLVPFKLNLSTEKLGRGRQFSFSRFGEVKRILYNDLASIFENYRSFMEQGYFYILDQKVIRKHGLDDIYEKILSKEMIEEILKFNPKSAVRLYETATDTQREIIDGMLVHKIKQNDGEIDYNIVSQLSKIGGRDIMKIAKEASELESAPVT